MPKTLFICRSNVGRSQIAEAYYNHFTKSKDAVSAATNPDAPLKHKKFLPSVIKIMAEDKISMEGAFVKLITPKMIQQCEKIYVMCKKEQCPAFLITSEKVIYWDVEDPYTMTIEETRKIRDLIKSKVQAII